MRCLGRAKFAGPVDDVFNPEQKQQRRRLDQHHPQIAQSRQRIDPHLRHDDAPKRLATGHAIGFSGFDLRVRHSQHRAEQDVRGKRTKDDGKGENSNKETVGFVHPLRRISQRHFRLRADNEIIALAHGVGPVRAFDLVAQKFDALIQSDHKEQKERDIGDAAHDGDVAFAEPRQGQNPRPCGHRTTHAERHGKRGGDREQQKHGAKRHIETHMLARGQVASEPFGRL